MVATSALGPRRLCGLPGQVYPYNLHFVYRNNADCVTASPTSLTTAPRNIMDDRTMSIWRTGITLNVLTALLTPPMAEHQKTKDTRARSTARARTTLNM